MIPQLIFATLMMCSFLAPVKDQEMMAKEDAVEHGLEPLLFVLNQGVAELEEDVPEIEEAVTLQSDGVVLEHFERERDVEIELVVCGD